MLRFVQVLGNSHIDNIRYNKRTFIMCWLGYK